MAQGVALPTSAAKQLFAALMPDVNSRAANDAVWWVIGTSIVSALANARVQGGSAEIKAHAALRPAVVSGDFPCALAVAISQDAEVFKEQSCKWSCFIVTLRCEFCVSAAGRRHVAC